MLKRMTLMLLALALFFGAVFGWKAFVAGQIRAQMAASGPPVATVSTAPVLAGDWSSELFTVATLNSSQSVEVSAQLDGQITRLGFSSGDQVAAGDLLVEQYVDDDKALLKALQADRDLARLDLQRAEELVREKLVSQAQLDAARSKLDRVNAEIENVRAIITKKSIRAPFGGQLGIRRVNLGQFVKAGDPLVRLESMDQLFADFQLPQQAIPLIAVDQTIDVTVDAWPDDKFPGHVLAVEPVVDSATRNFLVRAVVDNESGRLRPGMFAEIRVKLPSQREVLTVPQSAITFSPFGSSVFVVTDTDGRPTVRNVIVQTGETRGDVVEVITGLSPNQQVVTSGQLKLRDGAPITIDNSVLVNASETVDPDES